MCDGEDRTTGLELLLQVVDGFVALPAGERSPFEIGDQLIRLRHGIDLLELRFARDAAAFAATEEAVAQGSTSPIDWVRHQCGMSANAAARSIATGEVAEQLPASVAALDTGRIGFAHLAHGEPKQGTLGKPRYSGGALQRPGCAGEQEHSVSRFAFDCTHARHRADAAGVLAEQVNAVEYRRLELTRCEDGRIVVRGLLDAVGGATLRVALAPLCARSGAGDERPRARRLADGLVELAFHALDHGFATDRGGPRTHLQLTA